MKLTKEEQEIYDRVINSATLSQIITIWWWDIFSYEKRQKLHDCIMYGMSWKASYEKAKDY